MRERSASTKKRRKSRKAKTCLHCEAKRRSRGLCERHYYQADYEVRAGRTTWEKLVEQGLALPPGGQSKNPFRGTAAE